MKSLSYILTDRPRTLDDCLDLARKTGQAKAQLSLTSEVTVGDTHILKQLLAMLDWQFDDRTAACASVCGGFFLDAPPSERRRRVLRANHELGRLVSWVESCGVVVEASDCRFGLLEMDWEQGST